MEKCEMPQISIIVPVYKVEDYLPRCVDSLIHQTMQDIEIILVDDGSPDGCPEMCDEYAKQDDRIKVIHKKNGGVSAARNDGLTIATGEWVYFCDSDDWMELDACRVLVSAGEQHNADVVMADINRIRDGKVERVNFFDEDFTTHDRDNIDSIAQAILYPSYCGNPSKNNPATGFFGGPWNKVVRRKLLMKNSICFDTALLGVCDDMLYSLYVLSNAESLVYVSIPVYDYVMISASITQTYKVNMLDVNKRIFSAFDVYLKKFRMVEDCKKAYAAFIVRRFEESLRFYFFSNRNEMRLTDRLEELKKLMLAEPYYTASSTVDMNALQPHHRRVARLLKKQSANGLYSLYKFKEIRGGGTQPAPKTKQELKIVLYRPFTTSAKECA